MKLKKKQQSTSSNEDWGWGSPQEESWLSEEPKPESSNRSKKKFKLGKKREEIVPPIETKKEKTGRGGKRIFSVEIGYDDHGTDISDLLMESIASRQIINAEWDEKKWSDYLHHVGQVPFYVLSGDPDRFHLCIYAAELLRKKENRESRDIGLNKVNTPTHDLTEVQPEIDGVTWGEPDEGPPIGDFGITHSGKPIRSATVRDQIEQAQKAKVEKHKSEVLAAQVANNTDPYILKWVQAEKIARTVPRKEWDSGQLDYEFECMVKYCYQWLRDIAEVPHPYPMDMKDLFWPRPTILSGDKPDKERRDFIVEKILKFWRKSVKKALANGDPINLKSESYRTTLAAKNLSSLIEQYARNHARLARDQSRSTGKPILEIPDEELESQIKRAAVEYFNAHFPVELDGAKPGPISTSDPDYVEYIRLCRKYKLTEGVLLHEQGL